MSVRYSAEELNFDHFRVANNVRSGFNVSSFEKFYSQVDRKWRLVFHVSFTSLNKLHNYTNNNYFSVVVTDETVADRIVDELISEGRLYLNNYPGLFRVDYRSNQ